MIHPVHAPLMAYRWQPFVEVVEISGIDLASADIYLQVRLYPDQPGDPLVALLRNDNLNSQGLAVRFVSQDALGLNTFTIQIRINETTIEQLLPFPNGTEIGAAVELAYDLVIDAPGLSKARWMTGPFLIQPGVTQA